MLPLALFFVYMLLSFCILIYVFLRALGARRVEEKKILWNHYVFAFASLVISMAFPGYLWPYVWQWATSGAMESTHPSISAISHSWSRVAVLIGPSAGLILSLTQSILHKMTQPKQRTTGEFNRQSSYTSSKDVPLMATDSMPRLYESMLQECVMTTLLSLFLLFTQKDKEIRASSSTESGSTSDEGKLQTSWRFTHQHISIGDTPYLEDAKRWFRVVIKEYLPGLYTEVRQLHPTTEEDLIK